MKKFYLLPILVLGVILVLSGCTKTAENKIEDSIEDSTGGQADVDLDDGNIMINTNEGTFEAGDNVSLPSGFPSDVYVYDGTITASTTTSDDMYVVSIQTSDSPEQVKDTYETELANDGWEITSTLTLPTGVTLGAEKGSRYVTVTAGEEDGDTFVTIGVTTIE